MNVTFYPKGHRYFDEFDREYISVNKYIDQCMGSFDAKNIAAEVTTYPNSIYYGKTKEDVLREWNVTKETGTHVHKVIEDYIKHAAMPQDKALESIVRKFSKLTFTGKLLSERIVWDDVNLIAGTIDIIEQLPNCLKIWDIKTSRKITDEKHYRYSVQVEFYRCLLSLLTELSVEIGGIIWIKDFVHQRANASVEKMPVVMCIKEVREMINARKIKLWKKGVKK